jgi:hypothetical protein
MNVYDEVRQAILDKQQVIATYHGYLREMCPHVIGTKKGRPHALFFQFGGESSKGLPPGGEWRCLDVDDLTLLETRPGEWHSGSRHSQPQSCVDEIDVEVDY